MGTQKQFFDSKIIFLFGAGVIAVLSLLFHKSEQLKSMFDVVQPDRISVIYLQLLVDMDPSDDSSRLALAKQYVAIGKTDEARLTLKPFMNNQGQYAAEGKLLSLELDLNAYFAKPTLNNTKAKELSELQTKITAIADLTIPDTVMAKVIEKSLALNKPDLAAKLYERWAKTNPTNSVDYLQEAGRWYVAAGQPMAAANLYHDAFVSAKDTATAKDFAHLAVNATRAADQGKIGLNYLKEFRARFPDDQNLLNEAIVLSLATNDPKQAYELGQSGFAQDSNNPDQLKKQIELALAVGKLDVALKFSEKLSAINANDFDVRRRTAQIAEWYGQSSIALGHWAQLIKLGDSDSKTQDNFFRLANGLKEPAPIITALSAIAQNRLLADNELSLILESANKKSNANTLGNFLHGYLQQHPTHKKAWMTLARTQINTEKIPSALETLQHIAVAFKADDIELSVLKAGLLNRIGQPEKAYQQLFAVKQSASSQDIEFWKIFANFSWQKKHTAEALQAYHLLWQSNAADSMAAERLIQLFRDQKQPKKGIDVAKTAYRKFNEPRWLLLAMDTAAQFKSWQDLREMLQIVNATRRQEFEKIEMYWLLRAQLSNHNQQHNLSLTEYKTALKLNPNSIIAKDGVMWNLIGQQESLISRIHLASNSFQSMFKIMR